MSSLTRRLMAENRSEVDLVRVNELEATYRLWHKRIRVFLPQYATLTPEQLKYYGTAYNSGLSKEERDRMNREMTSQHMSVIRMIALYAEGIPMAFPDRMIAVGVYKDIKTHTQTWMELGQGSLNQRSDMPPVEDFDLMLEFAEHLECYLDYYYRNIQSKDFTPFRKVTMNRFINSDKYMHREESTYNKLRTGIYSYQTDRTSRRDDIRRSPMDHSIKSHYQEQPEFSLSDAEAAMNSIRG